MVQSSPLSRTMASMAARSRYWLRSANLVKGANRWRMKNPSPGSWRGGRGYAGDGTVPMGAALTTRSRRVPVARIASTIAVVPVEATPVSDFERGPSPDSTASQPFTAAFRAPGSGWARSTATLDAGRDRRVGSRTTAVTSCPASPDCSSSSWPIPPVAATMTSLMTRDLSSMPAGTRRTGNGGLTLLICHLLAKPEAIIVVLRWSPISVLTRIALADQFRSRWLRSARAAPEPSVCAGRLTEFPDEVDVVGLVSEQHGMDRIG